MTPTAPTSSASASRTRPRPRASPCRCAARPTAAGALDPGRAQRRGARPRQRRGRPRQGRDRTGRGGGVRPGAGAGERPQGHAPARPASRPPSSTVAPVRPTLPWGRPRPHSANGAAAASRRSSAARQWGADESLRTCSPDYVDKHQGRHRAPHGELQHLLVRRRAGPAARHLRVPRNGNGWCDIGYQFFVDRFGRLFEGRYGGDYKNIVGAQAGRLQLADLRGLLPRQPRPEHRGRRGSDVGRAVASIGKLIGWKSLAQRLGPVDVGQLHLRRQHALAGRHRDHPEPRVSGHRDFSLTECPGDLMYSKLPSIRATAADGLHGRRVDARHPRSRPPAWSRPTPGRRAPRSPSPGAATATAVG